MADKDQRPETLISKYEARPCLWDTFSPLNHFHSVWRFLVQWRLRFLQIDPSSLSLCPKRRCILQQKHSFLHVLLTIFWFPCLNPSFLSSNSSSSTNATSDLLTGLIMVPRELETMLLQNFGGTNKEYYGIFDTGL